MKFFTFLLLLFASLKAQNDDSLFITKLEYGKMLYENPRGIGCNSCHSNSAKGKQIVQFKHTFRGEEYLCTLYAPNIKDVSFEAFKTKVNSKRNPNKKFKDDQICEKLIYKANIMPTYYLTQEEIESIYFYIQSLN